MSRTVGRGGRSGRGISAISSFFARFARRTELHENARYSSPLIYGHLVCRIQTFASYHQFSIRSMSIIRFRHILIQHLYFRNTINPTNEI